MKQLLLLLITCTLIGCSSKPRATYTVGVDPSFFPQDFEGKEMFVLAFTNELLDEIGKIQRVEFRHLPRAWDNLLYSLDKGEYDAMLSSIDPNLINLETYTFSDIYLKTGPVLVIKKGQPHFNLDRLKNGYIGVIANTKAAFYVETQNNLMPKYFPNSGALCFAVQDGSVNGALVQAIPAISFTKDLFQQELKIDSDPMFHEGIRLVKLKDNRSKIIRDFNEGLSKVKKKGIYSQLRTKWGL